LFADFETERGKVSAGIDRQAKVFAFVIFQSAYQRAFFSILG
jgi:hypothetical protein